MSEHLFKCPSCQKYTLQETCPSCNIPAITPKPPKYSPEDKYGSYRRDIKKPELIAKGLY